MDVKQAAEQLRVSPRRIVAMIGAGQIDATKVGRSWQIETVPSLRSRRTLSAKSRQLLARALHTRSLAGTTGQERARTAERIRELRSSSDPATLLIEWWGGAVEGEAVNFGTNLVRHAVAGNRDYVREALHLPRREYLRRPEDLADAVATERRIRALSVDALARAADVPVSDIRRLERAVPVTSPSIARKVLRALDIEPTALPDSNVSSASG